MRQGFLLTFLLIALTGCTYRARNADYQGHLRRATRNMLSVDFVDLIVEQEDENKEDFVALSKDEANLYEEGTKVKVKQKTKRKYFVMRDENGDWKYLEDR